VSMARRAVRFRAANAHAMLANDDLALIAAAKERGQAPFNWAVADYLARHP
jgi:hypothetical protein